MKLVVFLLMKNIGLTKTSELYTLSRLTKSVTYFLPPANSTSFLKVALLPFDVDDKGIFTTGNLNCDCPIRIAHRPQN